MSQQIGKIIHKTELSDNAKRNRMALLCYTCCCLLYSVFGFFSYRGVIFAGNRWEPFFYYTLLWIPLLTGVLIYRDNKETKAVRYSLLSLFFLFYMFALFAGRERYFYLFIVPILIIAVSYHDFRFFDIISVVAVLLNFLNALGMVRPVYMLYFKKERMIGTIMILLIAKYLVICAKTVAGIEQNRIGALKREQERFKALVSVGIHHIFEYDIQNDTLMTSKSSHGQYGNEQYYHDFKNEAKKYRYILYEDWNEFDRLLNQCETGRNLVEAQLRLRDEDGDYKWFQIRGKVVFNEQKRPARVIGIMENIDEHKRIEIRQADEEMRDPLTKLYRGCYVKEMIDSFLKNQDCSEYAGFLMLDIDNFEILNEKMGTAFGDEILKNIAADMENNFYPTDILGRTGGDEFVVLMKNIRSVDDIDIKIREIQRVINKTYIGETMNFGSTVAIGAAVFPIDGVDFDTLYLKSEKAMYHAKEAGKNCYGFYDADSEGIYSKYKLPDQQNRFMYEEKNAGCEKEKSQSDSLIELAFKLIEESKDTDSAINLLIRQVARQMNLGGICIRERIGKEYKVSYPYQCCTAEFDLGNNAGSMDYEQDQWQRMLREFKEKKGLVYNTRVSEVTDDTRRKVLLAYGVQSYARCAFYEKGEFAGNIDFLDFEREREWTHEELLTIRAVTNVVSSYLLKMKAYEDASDTVERLTGYDSVTGLYKYEKFLELTSEYIEYAPHGRYAITYVDFSNFKFINETYGYETGDKILKDYADTANSYKDIYIYGSRVFSDNMVSLIRMNNDTNEEMVAKLRKASNQFTRRIQQEYLDSNLIIAIGLCPFIVDGQPVPIKNLISNANVARKEAKLPDKPRCLLYNDEMGKRLTQEVAYTNDMENAFKNQEFVVYLQPKVNLKDCRIDGAEALVRWQKKDGTIIYPNDFIPVFEKNKTITLLDYFVYTEVCKYLANRIRSGEEPICISVNVSRVHLYTSKQMVSYVKGLIHKYKIPPHLLEFELTETVFTEKVGDTIHLMEELRKLGVKVSMDDFGSGYSSLNVLTKLPLDVLKLDKDFLKDFEQDCDEKIIIPSIIDMAKKLHLSVVCEGVETREQVQFLQKVGCDYAQGYYYSKPIPIPQFNTLLARNTFQEE